MPPINKAIIKGITGTNPAKNENVPKAVLIAREEMAAKQAEQEKHDEKLNQASGDGRRNAPCPCGSGLKYKHCCGKLH